jgi:hypothetical protein
MDEKGTYSFSGFSNLFHVMARIGPTIIKDIPIGILRSGRL